MNTIKRHNPIRDFISIIVMALLFLNCIDIDWNLFVYAAESDSLYDTIPIIQGNKGKTVKAQLITISGNTGGGGLDIGGGGLDIGGGNGGNSNSISFYLVQLPANTTSITFYGGEASSFTIPDNIMPGGTINQKGKSFDADTFSNNGWWTIDVADLKIDSFANTNNAYYNNGLTQYTDYCPEAMYVELVNDKDTDRPLFIQIGDKDSALDVFATYIGLPGGYLEGTWSLNEFKCQRGVTSYNIQLCTGRRYEPITSSQEIFYTIDGTDPTSSDTAQQYSKPIEVKRNCVIKAATRISDEKWGTIAVFNCTVDTNAPIFNPEGGWYGDSISVSLECNDNSNKVYYTIDNSDPVVNGTLNSSAKKYTGPIRVSSDTVVKAVTETVDEHESVHYSSIVSADYIFSTGIDISCSIDSPGVWLDKHRINTDRQAVVVMPNGYSDCHVNVLVANNALVQLNGRDVKPQETVSGRDKYSLLLDVLEDADDEDLSKGKENSITVTNDMNSTEYKIYCIASKYNDVPDEVRDYFIPASQYTNNGGYGTAPNKTLIGKPFFNNGSSLGNFGGYITWFYKNGIKNDPNNPYGVDFLVIGNSFDGTNEAAEPGNIMVSEDGENWYTLAGSIHYDDSALWNQQVTYRNENGLAHYKFSPDNWIKEGTSIFQYPNLFYYPLHGDNDIETFTTSGTLLVPESGVNDYGNIMPPYPAFGYADVGGSTHCSNEAENPYGGIVRDGTRTDRVTTNRNGDACDISWAVDENGNPKKLDEIHYVKVQTASFIDNGAIGEKSTEVNCMRIAKPADSAVGVTTAPSSIKIDGKAMELKPGEMVDANVNGVFDVAVDAPEDTNVYINSLRSHTAFMEKAPHKIVRVIVQEGEKEPLIYYYNIKQEADSNTVYEITLDPGKGLIQDKEKLTCYIDSDTIENFGGKIPLPDAQAAKEVQKFAYWYADLGEEGEKRYNTVTAENAEELAGKTLKAFYAKAEDVDAVRKVEALIEALPEADKVTLDDNEVILEARQAYDALSDDQKALLIPDHKTKLEADEAAVIKLVEDMIDTLPEAAAVKTTDAEAVIAAGVAFDSLADTQKALVDQAKAEKLAAVRLALFDAFAAAIPDEVTEEQEDALAAAQAVYDSLPNDLKVKAAANYIKLVEAKLSVAMEKLEKANQQIADKQSEIDKLTNETIPALTQQLNDKIAELKTAKEEDIPALQAEIAELEQKLEKAGSDLADANAEIEELRKELVDNSIKDLIESAEKTIAAIQKDLKEAGDSISTKAIKALVETADQILDAAKTKAEEASAALEANAKEIASLRDQVAKASADLAKAGEELAKAVASGKASEAEITGLKDRLAEAEAAKTEAEKAAQEALAGKQTSDEALEAAQKALKETQDELEKTAAELAALQAEIAASKFKVTGLTVTSKSRKFTVTWTKFDGADGYKVQYRKKGAKKYKNLKELTKNKVVSKKLKKGISYQFRVRTYKMVGEKKVYGKWAKSKAVKCK